MNTIDNILKLNDIINSKIRLDDLGEDYAPFLLLDGTETGILNAIINGIPNEEILQLLNNEQFCSQICPELKDKLLWSVNRPEPTIPQKNQSINCLIQLFQNKKSKQVEYAREKLMKRYESQSYLQQRSILIAFFNGSKKDRNWAGRRLFDNWDSYFESIIINVWDRHKDVAVASVILRHSPTKYIYDRVNDLADVAGYGKVCARMAREPNFSIDWDRLTIPENFYVRAKNNIGISNDTAFSMFKNYLLSIDGNALSYYDNLATIPKVKEILWCLGKLKLLDALFDIWELSDRIKKHIAEEEGSNLMFELHREIGLPIPSNVIEEYKWYGMKFPAFVKGYDDEPDEPEDNCVIEDNNEIIKSKEDYLKILSDPEIGENIKQFIRVFEIDDLPE